LTVQVFAFGGAQQGPTTTVTGFEDGSIAGFVYKNLASPINLTAGYYTIAVSGFTATTPYNDVTAATFDSVITQFGSEGGQNVAGNSATFNSNNIAAGSFSTVAVTPVPEPETYAMLAGLGLVGFGLYRRCRK